MRAIFFRLVLVGAMSAVAPLAHSQLLSHRDLSYSMAKTIAETAIDSCAAKGYAVSAVVVDRAGEVIVAMRADNAGPHTMENARRKAYTARSFRTSTTAYAKRFADNDPVVRQQVTLPNVIAIPGGLPVKLGDEVIAGVGVSGSPGVDEPCVQAGLDADFDQRGVPIGADRNPANFTFLRATSVPLGARSPSRPQTNNPAPAPQAFAGFALLQKRKLLKPVQRGPESANGTSRPSRSWTVGTHLKVR